MRSQPHELPDEQLQNILLVGARGLSQVNGVGAAEPSVRYVATPDHRLRCLKQLMACATELAKRESIQRLHGQALTAPQVAKDYFQLHFRGYEAEAFVVLFVDASLRFLAVEELFRGSLSQTSVYPREVVKRALIHNAGAVFIAHNHPSGMAEPSRADEYLTKTLQSALSLMEVRLLDHFVVGADAITSFAERGLL